MSAEQPGDYEAPSHTAEVLALFSFPEGADNTEGLWWRCDNGNVTLYAQCSDLFYWGTSDCEPIHAEDMPILRQALADLRLSNETYLLGELFAARKRGMRPMSRWLHGNYNTGAGAVPNEASLPLFEAAGPVRKAADTGRGPTDAPNAAHLQGGHIGGTVQ